MSSRTLAILVALAVGLQASAGAAKAQKKRNNQEPKPQITPLPPEPPMALAANTESLDFHISPLLKTGGLSAQIRQSLGDLIRNTHGETIVKLRAFVAGSGDARRVQVQVAELFGERKLPLPTLSILQIGALGQESAQVVIEAVVSTHRDANPNGLVFFFGQRGSSLEKALAQLRTDAEEAHVPADHLLACTCFTSRMENYTEQAGAFRTAFPNAAVNLVQAVRDPASNAASCNAVGQPSEASAGGPILLIDRAHATLVHSTQLIFTGLQLSFGNYLDDAQEAFARLSKAANALGANESPVEVNGFALDPTAAAALRKRIPLAPGTFTVQEIEGLPSIDASAGVEAVLAPNVDAAAALGPGKTNDTIHPE